MYILGTWSARRIRQWHYFTASWPTWGGRNQICSANFYRKSYLDSTRINTNTFIEVALPVTNTSGLL